MSDVMIEFAKDELRRLRSSDEPDEMQDMIEKHVLEMVRLFSDEGHSGSSANYTVAILEKVLRFEPVTPLTGEDDEWNEVSGGPGMTHQNRRCSHVFKRADGTAYDGEAYIFRHPDGACFTSINSRKDITFPYRPTREYVNVDDDGNRIQQEETNNA